MGRKVSAQLEVRFLNKLSIRYGQSHNSNLTRSRHVVYLTTLFCSLSGSGSHHSKSKYASETHLNRWMIAHDQMIERLVRNHKKIKQLSENVICLSFSRHRKNSKLKNSPKRTSRENPACSNGGFLEISEG